MGGRGTNSVYSGTDSRLALGSPVQQPEYPTEDWALMHGDGDHVAGQSIKRSEMRALEDYTSSSSINRRLADAEGDLDKLSDDDLDMVESLDNAMKDHGWNRTEKNTEFVRGAGAITCGVPTTNDLSAQEIADYINNNRLGTRNMNVGYTSITNVGNIDTARSFADGETNGIILEYQSIGKGMRGVYVSGDPKNSSVSPISSFGRSEEETLLQRNVVTVPIRAWVADDGRPHVLVRAYPAHAKEKGLENNIGK